MVKKIKKYISNGFLKLKNEHIGAFSAKSAFFLMLSFVPLSILILLALNAVNIENGVFYRFINSSFKTLDLSFLRNVFEDISKESWYFILFNTIFALWSGSKGFYALLEGFHHALRLEESQNFIYLRIRSIFYSFVFVIMVAVLSFIGVFGAKFQIYLHDKIFISIISKAFLFIAFFIILILLYYFLPDWDRFIKEKECSKKPRFSHILFSALLISVIIYVFTFFFSSYIVHFGKSKIFESLKAIYTLMLWLYFVMYIIFLGFRFMIYFSGINKL